MSRKNKFRKNKKVKMIGAHLPKRKVKKMAQMSEKELFHHQLALQNLNHENYYGEDMYNYNEGRVTAPYSRPSLTHRFNTESLYFSDAYELQKDLPVEKELKIWGMMFQSPIVGEIGQVELSKEIRHYRFVEIKKAATGNFFEGKVVLDKIVIK